MNRYAIVTMRVPLREDYPWKDGQGPIEGDIQNALSDALHYKDYVAGASSMTVKVIGAKDAKGTGSDKLGDGVRDRGAQPSSDGSRGEG